MSIEQTIADGVWRALEPRLLSLLSSNQKNDSEQVRLITVGEACAQYRSGRDEVKRLILEGELPAVSRRMRGGREGWLIRVEDAERVLAGVQLLEKIKSGELPAIVQTRRGGREGFKVRAEDAERVLAGAQ